jgi:hypothetical protein
MEDYEVEEYKVVKEDVAQKTYNHILRSLSKKIRKIKIDTFEDDDYTEVKELGQLNQTYIDMLSAELKRMFFGVKMIKVETTSTSVVVDVSKW